MGRLKEQIKKSKGSYLLILGALLGLLLIFFGTESKTESSAISDNSYEQLKKTDEYVSELEDRVSLILSRMDGISDVTVIITADSTTESVYAENDRYDNGTLSEKEYVIVGKNDSEAPITLTLIYPRIRGVAVVCRGGSNPINKEKIIGLISSLFDIPSKNVYVCG